ncbi:uncharacterized protein EKO05_0006176 [Ascochyta rabiei]|uniref:uncharacterized protein n=1 Tax=Didymella rabiei TaxID=5454 RepID=UPI0022017B6C|nr:uncharacterized protein EKO05_0006176 [Ascochyta rabiei]UPX15737.1 hypothetical protein EKO05_0006176 [Ascochyta rabiei]
MCPRKSKSELKRLPPVAKPTERFGRTEGPKVLLLVGHDGLPGGFCRFLVSQSCLEALGPRWQQLVSNRAKAKTRRLFSTLPKTISLRDEHANAMRLIMHIAHLQFTKLPKQLDFRDMVHLADIAARFDAHGLVVSHIDAWLAPYRDRLLHPGYEEWLFIAYEFGYETEYLELAKHLAMHCRVDPSGTCLLVPGIGGLLEGKFPVDTLAHINEGRRQILADMLRATYELWRTISEGINCKVANEDEPNSREVCAAINLFNFTRYLRGLELFPMLKDTTTYQPSPQELSILLSNAQHIIPIGMTVSVGWRGSVPVRSGRHGRCHIGHQLATCAV